MAIGPVVLAIPAFFVLIGVEVLVARARRQEVYNLGDSLGNIGTGILDQVLGSVSRGIFPFTIYLLVYENWALFRLDPHSALPWILAFVGSDFLYYWWHRFSHEVSFMWACHVVHHQSPQFNLSVALRQNWLAGFTSSPFYVPLALLGVPPPVFALMKSINLLYQFWIHTRLIGNLGPLEWILNTPSHHRVHHGIDPQYLDKNYAGMFIVWDRWFGTFRAESHPPTYGTLEPFIGVNAPWAYLQPWVSLTREAFGRRSFWGGLRVFFAHPASRPDGSRFSEAELEAQHRLAQATAAATAVQVRGPRRLYLIGQLALVVAAAVAFLLLAQRIESPLLVAAALAWIALSLVSLAAVASGRPFGRPLEIGRHLVLLAPLTAWMV